MAKQTTKSQTSKSQTSQSRASKSQASKSGSGKSKSPAAQEVEPVSEMQPQLEAYKKLARHFNEEPVVMRPKNLDGHARRMHVRLTLIEDHATRIDEQARGAQEKFAKLADSFFAFFRGTSLLFHRDMVGDDARMPTVLALGDVHPQNFGIMPNADNVPIFGVNDFDDVDYAPFTWDLKRGCLGFMIAAEAEGDYSKKTQRKIATNFIEGYRDGMTHYEAHGTERSDEIRADNAPKVLKKLFEEAEKGREEWLWDRYLNETGRGFRASDELTPVSGRTEEFQGYIDALAKTNNIKPGGRAGSLKVKDVCLRHGQGTASLGLARFYVLLEGPSENAKDDLIVEFKRARRSALHGLMPENPFQAGDKGDRIAHGQSVHLAQGDVFYGATEIDGLSFMSRERAPFREDVDLDDLSKGSFKKYAHACGMALAQAHARSDEAGQLDYDIEPRILEAMKPFDLFVDDLICFAIEAKQRLKQDHAFYKRDFELGAFDMTLKRYR